MRGAVVGDISKNCTGLTVLLANFGINCYIHVANHELGFLFNKRHSTGWQQGMLRLSLFRVVSSDFTLVSLFD